MADGRAAEEAAMAAALRRNQFKVAGADITGRCVDLTAQYGITPAALSEAYDLWSLKNEAGSCITADLIRKFQDHLKKEPPVPETPTPAKMSVRASVVRTPPGSTPGLQNVLADQSNLTLGVRTPTPGKKATGGVEDGGAGKRARLASAFKERSARGHVEATLNDHIWPEHDAVPMDDGSLADGRGRCAFELLGPQLHPSQRFMVDRLEDKVAYLDGRITAFAQALAEQGLGPPQPLAATTQAPALFVGRVCCDGDGRLNAASVQLEGDIATSAGARVQLDLSRLSALRLFPGQVVGVTGVNPTGRCLLAERLHAGAPPPPAATPPAQLARLARRTGGRPTSVVAAAGPFTTSADLAFEPLEELLAAAAALQGGPPTALLLAGPFLDAEHPVVAAGHLEAPLQHVFEQQVLQRVGKFAAAHPDTRVLLVPSTRDVMAAPVFPTPPLARPGGKGDQAGAPPSGIAPLPDNVTMLPNPATFTLGEVVVGVSTADVVKAVAGSQVARGPAPEGLGLATNACHVLTQRSFFPVFPPPVGALLDTSLAAEGLALPATPDVLVLPSDMGPFAKLLPGGAGDAKVVCVNPGRLARGEAGGTWAALRLRVAEEAKSLLAGDAAETNAPVQHRVAERCRADIIRI